MPCILLLFEEPLLNGCETEDAGFDSLICGFSKDNQHESQHDRADRSTALVNDDAFDLRFLLLNSVLCWAYDLGRRTVRKAFASCGSWNWLEKELIR